MDIKDVFEGLFNKKPGKDTVLLQGNGPFISVITAVGYAMHTGFTGVISTNTTFYTDDSRKKLSRIQINGNFSQYHQYWFTGLSNIFFEDHKIHLFGDTRYYKFPTQTYGLGPVSSMHDPLQIDYSYLRFYQVLFREVASNLFAGIGYNLDYHWNIEVDTIKGIKMDQFLKYQTGSQSVSSGISLNLLYDNRKNSVNPRNGTYVNLQFRPNMTFLSSNQNWQSMLIEIRHYFRLPSSSSNVLALWSYNDITLSGNPPYLDLPSTGWDDYSNTGRGYAPGRYTGRVLIYFESEYRFSLTGNGLLGAVVFSNLESIPGKTPDELTPLIPGGGFGLRIKMNKRSNINLCIDYGFGIEGSRGFIFNMGEVF
ncbi:MAG: hypothetical protein ABR974_06895 [Bacteroidales bacterium]